jgi:hypothetical protein
MILFIYILLGFKNEIIERQKYMAHMGLSTPAEKLLLNKFFLFIFIFP